MINRFRAWSIVFAYVAVLIFISTSPHQSWAAQDASGAVRPGDDFYTYANQAWLDSVASPVGFANVGVYEDAYALRDQRIKAIIHDTVGKGTTGESEPGAKIGALYSSYMDTARIEELGLARVHGELEQILSLSSHADVARWMASPGSSSVIGAGVTVDAENPRRSLIMLGNVDAGQPMLGLPNRTYYSSPEETYAADRAAYLAYVAATLERAGVDGAAHRAADVLALETKIASLQWTTSQLNDRRANYHLMSRPLLLKYAPEFPWTDYLDAKQIGDIQDLVLGTDTAVRSVAHLFASTPVDVWKSYLAFHWLQNHIYELPAEFRQASFLFNEQRISGAARDRPREDRATRFVSERLGPLVGQLYVDRYLPRATKERASELVGYLRQAFAERLAHATWMDARTRREAEAKLRQLTVKVGYPDVWRDYSGVRIDPLDLGGNVRRLDAADWEYQRARLAHPVQPAKLWNQTPQTIDANSAATLNAIEFPAGILQAPFFDPEADPAANFAAIGSIIGHEMGHLFDDQGANFDSQGQLRNWWTDETGRKFEARTGALVLQYDSYSPAPGLRVNGRQTLPENIGDLTGVVVAYDAYRRYVRDHQGGKPPIIDGLTGDQRFFLAYARAWRVKYGPEGLKNKLANDTHAPAIYRVNGVLRNVDAWYAAFDVGPADSLYLPPAQRVKIW